jgi:hypothetical protein
LPRGFKKALAKDQAVFLLNLLCRETWVPTGGENPGHRSVNQPDNSMINCRRLCPYWAPQ